MKVSHWISSQFCVKLNVNIEFNWIHLLNKSQINIKRVYYKFVMYTNIIIFLSYQNDFVNYLCLRFFMFKYQKAFHYHVDVSFGNSKSKSFKWNEVPNWNHSNELFRITSSDSQFVLLINYHVIQTFKNVLFIK